MVVDAGKEDSCESKNINKKGKQSYKERERECGCVKETGRTMVQAACGNKNGAQVQNSKHVSCPRA